MAVSYRRAPRTSAGHCAAYVDVIWLQESQTFYGALLILDSRGQPLEFVHNCLVAPSGFLWPEDQVRSVGVASLCHSLFAACTREPELIVCCDSLGSPKYCKTEICPMAPFAQVTASRDCAPEDWTWINDPPTPAMGAHALGESLRKRGLTVEPFSRIHAGLREVYPEAPWAPIADDRSK